MFYNLSDNGNGIDHSSPSNGHSSEQGEQRELLSFSFGFLLTFCFTHALYFGFTSINDVKLTL